MTDRRLDGRADGSCASRLGPGSLTVESLHIEGETPFGRTSELCRER